jgi:peptidylprolyl isomerase
VKKPLVVALAGAVLVLPLAACGSQSDQRVSDDIANSSPSSAATGAASPADSAAASAAASDAANAAPSISAPFVSVDCVSGQVMPTDAPPDGTTIGGVTASLQPTGVPTITIATDAQPATELGIADVKEGSGAEAQAGDSLTVNYCGVGLGSKALFDSSWTRGTPATFELTQVIQGWQQGVPGMKVGGTRLLVIPGALGYAPTPPDGAGIEPDETLVFVVELTAIN